MGFGSESPGTPPGRRSSSKRKSAVGRFSLGRKLQSLFTGRTGVDDETLAAVEELLIEADFGIEFTDEIVDALRVQPVDGDVISTLRGIIRTRMTVAQPALDPDGLNALLVFGVNGSGKTTSVGKLAYFYRNQGFRVLVAAADTYRDAAVDQLALWCARAEVPIVKQHQGADPGAVVFDACDAAVSRGAQVLLIDTAGRLHNSEQLMRELGKLSRILYKKLPDVPTHRILVIDATTGQNGLSQASLFREHVDVDGILLAKLDSSAKGGIASAISGRLAIPILYAGVGESVEDIVPFDVDDYLDALFSSH